MKGGVLSMKPPLPHISADVIVPMKPMPAVPAVRIEIFTTFAWKLALDGNVFQPGVDRNVNNLRPFLRECLKPGTHVRLSKLGGDVVAEGLVERYEHPKKGSRTLCLVGALTSHTILANMAVEIDFIPQSVIAKIDKLGRKKARGGIGRTPSFGTSGGEGMDPFPALSRLQLKDLFEHKPANSFVIHSVEDDEHSSSPGFRPLWVTYNSESGYASMRSLPCYMVEPHEEHPGWLKYSGFFSFHDHPWAVQLPNEGGRDLYVLLFPSAKVFHVRFPHMVNRASPYEVYQHAQAADEEESSESDSEDELYFDEDEKVRRAVRY